MTRDYLRAKLLGLGFVPEAEETYTKGLIKLTLRDDDVLMVAQFGSMQDVPTGRPIIQAGYRLEEVEDIRVHDEEFAVLIIHKWRI